MSQLDIARRAPEEHRVSLNCGARSVAYRYALEQGWITQAEHDEAREYYGSLWNYTGD
jgi:ribulose bisphosphate carboxylase small subunit